MFLTSSPPLLPRAVYVWYLMLVVAPVRCCSDPARPPPPLTAPPPPPTPPPASACPQLYPHTSADADAAERADAIAEEQRRLGEAASQRKSAVSTTDRDTQTDDPEWLHSAMAERGGGGGGAAPVVGTGAVRISMDGSGAGHAGVGGGADLLAATEDDGEGGGAVWK